MEIAKQAWPYAKHAAFSLAVDDIHPEGSASEEGIDYGGNMDEGNFRLLNALVEKWPSLRASLFVVADWVAKPDYVVWRTLSSLDRIVSYLASVSPRLLRSVRAAVRRSRSYRQGTFRLDLEQWVRWSRWLVSKVETSNFEVVPHGLNHYNPKHEHSSMEFVGLSLDESVRRLLEMEQIFARANIQYVRGFRPPGWGVTPELLDSLNRLGYMFLAGSADFTTAIGLNSRAAGVGLRDNDLMFPTKRAHDSFATFCANCNTSTWRRGIEILDAGGLALFQTHIAMTAFGLEAVSEKFVKAVTQLLHHAETKYSGRIWFASLGEITRFWLGRSGTEIAVVNQGTGNLTLRVANSTPYDVRGLTLDFGRTPLVGASSRSLRAVVVDESKLVVDVPARSDSQLKCVLA
jgi:peptidoglycan/xylan/chitin deacetylase (PgdA/CDA1 family)